MSDGRLFSGACGEVISEWTDYNGHMTVAYYGILFEQAADAFLRPLNISAEYSERTGLSFFARESRVVYKRELLVGDALRFTAQVLAVDERNIRILYRLYHASWDYLAATNESVYVHVDLSRRRATDMPAELAQRLARTAAAHAAL